MRILVLLSDGFGGHGGIAKFNRDLLSALCSHPQCTEVVGIPRLASRRLEALPQKLRYVIEGLNSKWRYVSAVFRTILHNPGFDLLICGHIHLLPLGIFAKLIVRVPLILVLHGIDAWEKTHNRLTNY